MKASVAPPPGPAMSEEEYLLFNELISDELGVSFPEHKREVLASRLRPRLLALRLPRYVDYYLQLQADTNGERKRLAELVTNNETFFFRETQQFDALFELAVDALKPAAAVPGSLRLLCAGCSSGEEPYTLNFFARQNFVQLATTAVTIDAFDVDASRIAMARRAEFGPPSFRCTGRERLERYFSPAASGSAAFQGGCSLPSAARAQDAERYVVKPSYRSGLRFFSGNILDARSYAAGLPYDVVFCRNVLIYFSEPALHAAVRNFAHALRTGGLLFLGASESIIGLSHHFETVRLGPTIAYRKVSR